MVETSEDYLITARTNYYGMKTIRGFFGETCEVVPFGCEDIIFQIQHNESDENILKSLKEYAKKFPKIPTKVI